MAAFCGYDGTITITWKKKKTETVVTWSYEDREYFGALINPDASTLLKEVSTGFELKNTISQMYKGEYDVDAIYWFNEKDLIALEDFSEVKSIKIQEKCFDTLGFGGGGQETITLTSKNNKYIKE